jgi:thiamine pyrophosphokinase
VLCADSGFDTACAWNLEPDEVIGDMDSVSDSDRYQNANNAGKILHFPEDKDFSDTELALSRCREKGFPKVILIGGGGGRFDHQLALFYSFFRAEYADLWITEKEEIRPILDYHEIRGLSGERVSFFPVSSGITKAVSTGLQWPLDSLEWVPGQFGLSNRMTENRAEVRVKNGRLVMIRDIHEPVLI